MDQISPVCSRINLISAPTLFPSLKRACYEMTSLSEGGVVGPDADVAIVVLWIMSFLALAVALAFQWLVNKLVGRPWLNGGASWPMRPAHCCVGCVLPRRRGAARQKSFATCRGQSLTALIALLPIIVVGYLCAREFRQYKAWRKRLLRG
ncbi:hypothetical protein WJ972_33420 [Achromobacter insuavis]